MSPSSRVETRGGVGTPGLKGLSSSTALFPVKPVQGLDPSRAPDTPVQVSGWSKRGVGVRLTYVFCGEKGGWNNHGGLGTGRRIYHHSGPVVTTPVPSSFILRPGREPLPGKDPGEKVVGLDGPGAWGDGRGWGNLQRAGKDTVNHPVYRTTRSRTPYLTPRGTGGLGFRTGVHVRRGELPRRGHRGPLSVGRGRGCRFLSVRRTWTRVVGSRSLCVPPGV